MLLKRHFFNKIWPKISYIWSENWQKPPLSEYFCNPLYRRTPLYDYCEIQHVKKTSHVDIVGGRGGRAADGVTVAPPRCRRWMAASAAAAAAAAPLTFNFHRQNFQFPTKGYGENFTTSLPPAALVDDRHALNASKWLTRAAAAAAAIEAGGQSRQRVNGSQILTSHCFLNRSLMKVMWRVARD